jgi:Flp pilus assembly pilin Flp
MFKMMCCFVRDDSGSTDMDDSLIFVLVSVITVAVLT